MRHTYATTALRSRVPVAVVSKTLGHARISITIDIYWHVLPSEMKKNVFDMFAVPLPVRDVPTLVMNEAVGHRLVTDQILTLEQKTLKCKKPVIDRLFFGGGGEIRTHDISLAKRALSH
jgi:Phage integrase family